MCVKWIPRIFIPIGHVYIIKQLDVLSESNNCNIDISIGTEKMYALKYFSRNDYYICSIFTLPNIFEIFRY